MCNLACRVKTDASGDGSDRNRKVIIIITNVLCFIAGLIVSPFLIAIVYWLAFAFDFIDLTGASTEPGWYTRLKEKLKK